MIKKKCITFSIACFNEEENVFRCFDVLQQVAKTMPDYSFEYVFVDNGSTDQTRDRIKKLVKHDKNIVGVFLSRNFGPESSGQAALDFSTGDAVIPYEADMQDPPSAIPRLIKKWEDGNDVVVGIRTSIEDSPMMTLLRTLYYRLFRVVSTINIPVNAGAFCLMDRKVVDTINAFPETYRFFRGLRAWAGFRTAYVPYKRRKRLYGKSSYTLFGYFQHAQRSFFGFSYFLLSIVVYMGFLFTILSFLFLAYYVLYLFINHQTLNPSYFLLVVIVFFGGIQLLAISIIGKYIQVIMEETKRRPLYIVDTIIGKTTSSRRIAYR